jgi:hypothetical protein
MRRILSIKSYRPAGLVSATSIGCRCGTAARPGYEVSGANKRTIDRLEVGQSIRKPIGRLPAMFDALGVLLAFTGERAERQHNDKPSWSPNRAPARESKILEATLHAIPLEGEPPSDL